MFYSTFFLHPIYVSRREDKTLSLTWVQFLQNSKVFGKDLNLDEITKNLARYEYDSELDADCTSLSSTFYVVWSSELGAGRVRERKSGNHDS